jgi:predicted exporter
LIPSRSARVHPTVQTRARPIVLIFAVAVLTTTLVLSCVTVRTDMTDFLPPGHTEATRLMLRELRTGAAASLIILAVEGAPVDELARISRAMTERLAHDDAFSVVNNGDALMASDARDVLFRYRYLLSDPTPFSVAALHQDLERLLAGLRSSASPLVARFGLADPTGAFLTVARQWSGSADVRSVDGVWFAPDRDRALIVARTRAGTVDLEGQERIDLAIRQAFTAAEPGGARLVASGPAVFARDAAVAMRGDVTLLSILSSVLLAGLLLWRFRSAWIVLVVGIPVMLGIAAAALIVQILFGFVHGVAIGFGVTTLGVTLDYPVLLVGHRKRGEAPPATVRRIGQAFALAVISAALGLTGMLFTGFPGLAQLGCFSAIGILVAAAVTRFALPRVIASAELAPVATVSIDNLERLEQVRHGRVWAAALCVAATVYLLVFGGPRWSRDLTALSPVPARTLALDAELRRELGAPDTGLIGLVRGDSPEAVLRQEESLLPTLDALRVQGAIAGAELAARFLPSTTTQRARQAALPDPATLSAALREAAEGMPYRAGAFQPFVDDVGASRTLAPLTPTSIKTGLIAARLAPLLFSWNDQWYGLIAPDDPRQPDRFADALRGAGAASVNIADELNMIVADHTALAWRWYALGLVAALLLIAAALRAPGRVAAVGVALAAAQLFTVTILTLLGTALSLIHIVSLQFVAGVGLDYALFFARRQLDQEERARTLWTLLTCNAMTVLTFGVLIFCRTPVLRQIGATVVIGAVAALIFAFLFAGPLPARAGKTA